MIVIDASAMVEVLVGRDVGPELMTAVADELAAPVTLDIEVLSALRGLGLSGLVAAEMLDAARHAFADLQILRHDIAPLADRIWALRHQFTTYDASYLALAEALAVPLVTCDAKLTAPGHRATVRVAPLGS